MRTKALQSLVATLSLLLSTVQGWAQAVPTPGSAPGGGGSALALILVIVGLFVIIGVGVKVYDVRRKRESEAIQIQAQVSDALMREQLLYGVPITATAHTSLWRRSPATVQVAGSVPSPQARETALRIRAPRLYEFGPTSKSKIE